MRSVFIGDLYAVLDELGEDMSVLEFVSAMLTAGLVSNDDVFVGHRGSDGRVYVAFVGGCGGILAPASRALPSQATCVCGQREPCHSLECLHPGRNGLQDVDLITSCTSQRH